MTAEESDRLKRRLAYIEQELERTKGWALTWRAERDSLRAKIKALASKYAVQPDGHNGDFRTGDQDIKTD